MPRATLAGHPLHPMLIVAPAGLIPFSAAMDLMHLATGRRAYADAARLALYGGVAGGAAAAVAGAMDYLSIERGTRAKRTANVHGGLNVATMAGLALNAAMRARGADARDPLPLALSLLGAVGLAVSGWYGAHLVYEHGMRVRPVDPLEAVPEVEAPDDEAIERALEAVVDRAPAGGPEVDGTPPPEAIPEAPPWDRPPLH